MAAMLQAPLRALRAPFRVAAVSHCKDLLSIAWQDGKQSNFPNIWLRSAARDPEVFDAGSLLYKRNDYVEFICKESPLVRAEHEKGSEDILVEWGDHLGTFNASWLRAQDHNINKDLCKKRDFTVWDANFKFPVYNYSERMENFDSWFGDLRKYGLAIFQGVPPNEAGILGLLHSIGQEAQRYHPTNILHIVKDSKEESSYESYTYAPKVHPMHVDTPYYASMHRLTALVGNRYSAPTQDTYSLFVDNLKVIGDIRREEPEAYDLLRTIPVRLGRRRLRTVLDHCHADEHYKYHLDNVVYKTMIAYDEREKLDCINMTNKHAGVDFSVFKDHTTMKKHYDAYRLLQKKLDEEANQQRLILKEGTAVLMNNGRISHGRQDIHATTERYVLSAFLSERMWDTRWRILNGQKSGLEEKWLYGCSPEQLEILADRKGE
uniref:trimethyllysine dioxygenase n=1 Tax=Actinia tenebrosa TaxID=6105 RepID=A0A6P8II30_ACTTE